MSLKVSHLNKKYGQQTVLNDVSFDITSGNIVGFLGPNGAGKSTTMKIITGYITDFEGDVEVCGIDVRKNPIEAKRLIGYLPENNPLYLDMYVKEYLQFVANTYNLGKQTKESVNEVIERVGLTAEYKKKISMLSKGYRQRVGLAQALVHNPQILILDEPTTGLDPNQLEDIRDLIKNIGQEKTVLFSTHIMQEVEAVCNRTIIIRKGTLVNDGSTLTQDQFTFVVETEQPIADVTIFEQMGVSSIKRIDANTLELNAKADIRTAIFRTAVEQNWALKTLMKKELNMEEFFRELTK